MSANTCQWEELLTPSIARGKLISTSIFITAFEVLKQSIVGRPRTFFADGYDKNGPIVGAEYETEVLSRNKSPTYASLDWLKHLGVIDDADIQIFENIKNTRNSLAHELHRVVFEGMDFKHIERYEELVALLRKIEVWWVVNVGIPANPDLDGQEIDKEGIAPGPVLMLQMKLEIVSGNEELLSHYRKGTGNDAAAL